MYPWKISCVWFFPLQLRRFGFRPLWPPATSPPWVWRARPISAPHGGFSHNQRLGCRGLKFFEETHRVLPVVGFKNHYKSKDMPCLGWLPPSGAWFFISMDLFEHRLPKTVLVNHRFHCFSPIEMATFGVDHNFRQTQFPLLVGYIPMFNAWIMSFAWFIMVYQYFLYMFI